MPPLEMLSQTQWKKMFSLKRVQVDTAIALLASFHGESDSASSPMPPSKAAFIRAGQKESELVNSFTTGAALKRCCSARSLIKEVSLPSSTLTRSQHVETREVIPPMLLLTRLLVA